MKKSSFGKIICIYAVALVLIIAGFIGTFIYCDKASDKLHTYEFTKDNLNIEQDEIFISVNVSKQWDDETLHPDIPIGAQYDGVLTNNSKYRFKNWSAKLIFSEDIYIDSSWNGEFNNNGRELTFVAEGDPANVASKNNATFGAVMYSAQLLELSSYTISGYMVIKPKDLTVYHILMVASWIWLIALIMYSVIEIHTKKYRRQQELDSEIIKQSMNTFTGFIDAKDTYTKGHSVRVAEYATEIARRMKLDDIYVKHLYYISLMHDCGKIGIPDAVLQKPGKLTDEEFKLIKSHTVVGDAILVNFTAIPDIRDGAHFHHE